MGFRTSSLIIYNRRVKRKYILSLILAMVFLIMMMGIGNILLKKNNVESARSVLSLNGSGSKGGTRKILVVSSFYPLYFMASEIGGDRVEINNLTPAGVEPHDYEPTARDMMSLQQAKLLILNGGKFEAWGEKVKDDLKNSGVTVVEVGKDLLVENDTHIWLSPELAKKEMTVILAELIQVDPENADYYAENERTLSAKMDKLQQEYSVGLSDCRRKEIVTSHAAFGYLAREFGLTQVAIAGMSPDAEPSTKQLTEIAKFAKEKEIKYIFFERLVSPKLAETIAEEVGAKTLVLDPIEGISDNDIKQGKNYLTVMGENLFNLRIALECQ